MKPPSGYGSWSTLSSSDPSTTSTTKTQREIELEEELSASSSQLKETQQKLKEASEQLKATQEAHDNLKQLLEKSVNNIQKQLQAQKDEMEESFDRKLAELQSQFAWQNTNPHTPPNQPNRKRQDTRPSPYEAHGIPQHYTMQAPHYPMQHFHHPYQQYHMNTPTMYRAIDSYHSTIPPHYPEQTEQPGGTEWNDTTDQLQEPFQEDGSEEQI
jgi:hypothetical protein